MLRDEIATMHEEAAHLPPGAGVGFADAVVALLRERGELIYRTRWFSRGYGWRRKDYKKRSDADSRQRYESATVTKLWLLDLGEL